MRNLQSDLDTLRTGLEKGLKLATSMPEPPKDSGKKALQAYQVNMDDHVKAGETFLKEEGPKLAQAALNVLAGFFIDIKNIADGVNK